MNLQKSKNNIFLALLGSVAMIIIVSCRTGDYDSDLAREQVIVSTDITNFWIAYDSVYSSPDTTMQADYLQSLFLDNASEGQKRMIEARRYTADEYLTAMTGFKEFWKSIRKNTENLEPFNVQLREVVSKLRKVYPDLKHSTIYYTMGNHRSSGTGVDSMVLIGTEFALGDSATVTFELPEHVRNYYKINPIRELSFLCVHEYVHTQQKSMVHNLLSLALYEGIAEFVAIVATEQKSPWKAFVYGPENDEKIRQRFEEDMFKPNVVFNWLWNSPDNEFGTSDLGYFVGYQIASRYYNAASHKKDAIKKLIELDYNDEPAVEELVNSTHYFSKPLDELYRDYESKRPTVIGIKQFENKNQEVDPDITEITIEFSRSLNGLNTGVDFGDLGRNAFPKGTLEGRKWGSDNKSWTIPVALEPNTRYQILISNNFRTSDGVYLKPYLIDFKTK